MQYTAGSMQHVNAASRSRIHNYSTNLFWLLYTLVTLLWLCWLYYTVLLMLCCTWNNGKVIGLTMWCFQDSVGILDTYVGVARGNPSTIDNWENLRPKLWQQRHSVTYYVNLVAVSQVLFVLFLQWYCTVILFFENSSSDKWRRGSISTGMGVYNGGFGAAFSTNMKLYHLGRRSFVPAQARFTFMFNC